MSSTISEIRSSGTNLLLTPRPIIEPLNAPIPFSARLIRFQDNFDLSTSSHIYRYLLALCGDSGAGSLKRLLLFPKLQDGIGSTHFSDLDKLYGNLLGLPRLPEESYTADPKNEVMTQLQWQEVQMKDASYRGRCLLWMRAILEGGTPLGISLAAEAASGIPCDIVEQYVYLQNSTSDLPLTLTNYGVTTSNTEFVIIPRTAVLTQLERKRILAAVDRIRPNNTVVSINQLTDPRIDVNITGSTASSEYFVVTRTVTGRPDVDWPDVDPAKGFWIIPGQPVEAPQFAFYQSQETSTFLSVVNSSASSTHVGQFNIEQKSLFSNLQNSDPYFVFSSTYAYAQSFAPIQLSTPWLPSDNNVIVVNNYYPLEYFANSAIAQRPAQDPRTFWSSDEAYAPSTEVLTLDFGAVRPINYLDLELSLKPIDMLIEWSLDNLTWHATVNNDMFAEQLSTTYSPSLINPWIYRENHFELVQARYLRITFTRRTDAFPLFDSDPFQWSVDVRNLHAANYVVSSDDFIADSGVDVLGNTYSTNLVVLGVGNINSGTSFWQSQPNPVSDAVEAIYFDVRVNANPGTMAFLDNEAQVGIYDTWGMAQMETAYLDGVTFDEIYVDPVTAGPYMHIYWSNDDEPDVDYKLWNPVPKTYILRKGYHALPETVTAKYVKLEFSNLVPMPYNAQEYPVAPTVTYRKFPTWVQVYFDDLKQLEQVTSGAFGNLDIVNVDPLNFGFQRETDNFDTSYSQMRRASPSEAADEIQSFIASLPPTTTSISSAVRQQQESQIVFNSTFMWQKDLVSLLDTTRALSRYLDQTEASAVVELAPLATAAPSFQSVADLSSTQQLLTQRIMYFPMVCRHQYQLVQATRSSKSAYFVGISYVSFHRRNYSVSFDEPLYLDSLDGANTTLNEFTLADWNYIIQP